MRLILILLLAITVNLNAQQHKTDKLSEDAGEVIKEKDFPEKASQDYDTFLKFKKRNSNKNGAMFSNTQSIDVPTIGGRVRATLVDSGNGISLAAPSGGGLWIFATDGSSFEPVDDFAPFMTVTDIAQSPFNADEIIISTGDEYHGLDGNGLFRSTDKGVTFTQLPNTDPVVNTDFRKTRYIEYHPTRQNELYVVASRNLLRSIDNGVTWTRVYAAAGGIKSVDFNNTGEVLISVDNIGLYKSPAGNLNSFVQLTGGLPSVNDNCIVSVHKADRSIVYSMFADVDPTDPNRQVGQVYKSTDGGNSWSYRGLTNYTVTATWFVFAFEVHPTNPDLLLGGSVGFGYSEDGGATWVSTRGFEVDFHAMSFDVNNPNIAYIGYDQGIGKLSFDQTALVWVWNGTAWVQEEQLLQEEIGKEIGFNTSQIYYGDYYPSQYGDDLVFGQQDGGSFASFQATNRRIFVGDGAAIFISRQDPNKIIGSTQNGRLYKTDQGLSPAPNNFVTDARFVNNHTNFITEFAVNEADGDQVYFSTNSDIQRSLDFADNFNSIYSYTGISSIKMAVTPEADPTVFVGGRQNAIGMSPIIKIDNAATTPVSNYNSSLFTSSEGIDRITTDPDDFSVAYVTTFAGGAYKLTYDASNNVTKTDIKGNAVGIVFNIVIALKDQDILVAGSNVGLLSSDDGGANWTLNNEIPYCQVRDLKYREDDQRLFVFTYGRGAWATTIDESDCPANLSGLNKLIGIQSSDAVFATDGILQSEQTINAQVDYRTGDYVEILDDFQVNMGRQFQIYLDGCNN